MTCGIWFWGMVLALSATPGLLRGQPVVQRTMGAAPSAASESQSDAIDNMMRQYRTMWQKMSAAQQKAFLDSGGATPEQYERTLRTKGLSAVPASPTPAASSGRVAPGDARPAANVLDSLTTSMQDLNAIRDGNLTRIQKDGCPPEVASRIADLRGRLRVDEARLAGGDAPANTADKPKDKPAAGDAMAIASDWFKQPAKAEAGAARPAPTAAETHEGKLLDGVLAGAAPAPATIAARPIEAGKKQELEDEIARLKAEIAQLSGACAALKQ